MTSQDAMTIRNVFLDRDGTIIMEKHYLRDPRDLELLPGSLSGLQSLNDAGMRLFVVTNQSGIGRGMFTEEQRRACTSALDDILSQAGIRVKDQDYCPHAPDEGCQCRKPGTGMWEKLRDRNDLKAGESAIIGDKMSDVEFGMAAGFAVTILVLTGHGPEQAKAAGLPELGARTYFEFPARDGEPRLVLARDLASACGYLLSYR